MSGAIAGLAPSPAIRGNPSLVRDPPPPPPAAAGPAAGAAPPSAPAAFSEAPPPPLVERVAALARSGLTDAELGRHFGRGDGWAYKFRRRHGIASARPRPVPLRERAAIEAVNRAYAVQLPSRASEAQAAAFFRKHGLRFEDVSQSELARERAREARMRAARNVTAAVLGDPRPGGTGAAAALPKGRGG